MMSLRTKLIVGSLILLGTYIGLQWRAFVNTPDQCNFKTLSVVDLDSLNHKQSIVLEGEADVVRRLQLWIEGEILGSATLSFSDSDSTFLQTYELKNGIVNVEYIGAWNVPVCHLTYTPVLATRGSITVTASFVGD
jgi:hypothetical protein